MRSINLGNDKDPQKQQMAMFRLALYAAPLLTAIVIFVGLSQRHHPNLGVVMALIWLAVELPVSYYLVRAAKKRQSRSRPEATTF